MTKGTTQCGLSNVKKTLSAAALLAFSLFSATGFAARYLVVIKNKQTFEQTHAQLMMSYDMNLAQVKIRTHNGLKAASENPIEVEESLQNIQTLVVDTDRAQDLEFLKSSGLASSVEAEILHPAPKPVAGYTLSRPFDYHAISDFQASGAIGAKTPWGIKAVKAPEAWTASQYGMGTRVMVLDTGIDRDHPALKANYEMGKDFIGDFNQPYDVADHIGHGTHVAGTIAAQFSADGFVGVAPSAKLLMGRVCADNGCPNTAIARGINWAIQQKVDLISMSLGGPVATPAEKNAIEAADKAGITVVAASGNDGVEKVSFPAAFPSVVAVGAVDSKIQKAKFSQWGPELDVVAPGVDVVSSVPQGTGRESNVIIGKGNETAKVLSTSFQGAPEVPNAMTNSLVYAGLGKPENFTNINVAGKFALIKRGEVSFGDKVKAAIAAKAAGVVIFNNEPGLIQGSLTQDGSTVAIPVVMIEVVVGEAIVQDLTNNVVVTASIQTVPTDFAAFAGTSMATPHVAGVVALMKATNKKLSTEQVRMILKKTATPLKPNDRNEYGAGIVNAELAVMEASKAN